mgnify:CR=1 FL=1
MRCSGSAASTAAGPTRIVARRAADDEVRCAERRVLADEDLAGIGQAVDDTVDVTVADGHLEVLRRVAVGDGDRPVERVDEHAAPIRPE